MSSVAPGTRPLQPYSWRGVPFRSDVLRTSPHEATQIPGRSSPAGRATVGRHPPICHNDPPGATRPPPGQRRRCPLVPGHGRRLPVGHHGRVKVRRLVLLGVGVLALLTACSGQSTSPPPPAATSKSKSRNTRRSPRKAANPAACNTVTSAGIPAVSAGGRWPAGMVKARGAGPLHLRQLPSTYGAAGHTTRGALQHRVKGPP